MNAADIIERLTVLESECAPPEEVSATIVDLIEDFGAEHERLELLINRFGASPCAGIVQALAGCLHRAGQEQTVLDLWERLTPGILRHFKGFPEILSMSLNGLEGELRAQCPTERPFSIAESSAIRALLLDGALLPIELPRLRDDVYLGAISVIDWLRLRNYLDCVFSRTEIHSLTLFLRRVVSWLQEHASVFAEEIETAKHLIKALESHYCG